MCPYYQIGKTIAWYGCNEVVLVRTGKLIVLHSCSKAKTKGRDVYVDCSFWQHESSHISSGIS